MAIYQETIQLAGIKNFQECIFNTDKHCPHFNYMGPDNHQFRASSSGGLARHFFWRRVECWLPWLIKKIWNFRLVKMVKFGFFSIYFTHLKLPILKLIFHSHNSCNLQDVWVIESYIYTFSHKIKLTYLTANKSEK